MEYQALIENVDFEKIVNTLKKSKINLVFEDDIFLKFKNTSIFICDLTESLIYTYNFLKERNKLSSSDFLYNYFNEKNSYTSISFDQGDNDEIEDDCLKTAHIICEFLFSFFNSNIYLCDSNDNVISKFSDKQSSSN